MNFVREFKILSANYKNETEENRKSTLTLRYRCHDLIKFILMSKTGGININRGMHCHR